ncbi:MAG: SpoIID/LytB domain-containing protein [Bryobacteraceae bacterium]|nr:SpoIID/LytB domain-containing protein [Bryobacteraceae bacterium]
MASRLIIFAFLGTALAARLPNSETALEIRLFSRTNVTEARVNGQRIHAPHQGVYQGQVVLEVKGTKPLYLSHLNVSTRSGHLIFLANIPLEQYVASVLAGELNGVSNPETLKAMAIAIRTYAIRHRSAHAREGYDLCDTTHCQNVYWSQRSKIHQEAAESTEGLLLWWKGEPAATYYHAHCGGMSEASPMGTYLPAKADAHCVTRGNDHWRAAFTGEQLADALSLKVPAMTVEVTDRSPSGRANYLSVNGRRIGANQFQSALGSRFGWQVKSLLFDVTRVGDKFVFAGRGRGHGVGLCQIGAIQMGATGHTAREILETYYPGTRIGLTAQGLDWVSRRGERLELLSTDPAQEEFVLSAAERALKEAESRTRLQLTGRVQLKLFPTVATFRNATGESGTVAASTRGRVVRLQPAKTLQAKQVLEAILLHELLHVVLESQGQAGQPWWFREGLTLALSGDKPTDARYTQALQRVRQLVSEHGLDRVLTFWRQGLGTAIAREN